MISANELRLGNWVNTPWGFNKIESIHDDYVTTKNKIGNWLISECKPIPLTEEWLVKLGFKLHSDFLYRNFILPNAFCVSMWASNESILGFEKNGSFYWGEDYREIQYVHQLQNLYFALTGEELTLKQSQ